MGTATPSLAFCRGENVFWTCLLPQGQERARKKGGHEGLAPPPSSSVAGWASRRGTPRVVPGQGWGAHLLLELVELGCEVGHQLHGGVELVLKNPDLVLLPLPFVAHQGHGPHPGEPVQILVLKEITGGLNKLGPGLGRPR